jgi:hypothetical protein
MDSTRASAEPDSAAVFMALVATGRCVDRTSEKYIGEVHRRSTIVPNTRSLSFRLLVSGDRSLHE